MGRYGIDAVPRIMLTVSIAISCAYLTSYSVRMDSKLSVNYIRNMYDQVSQNIVLEARATDKT